MRILLLCLTLLGWESSFAELPVKQTPETRPVAILGGETITESELLPLIEGPLRQLRFQEYRIKRKALEELINQKLVAGRAKEKGLTPEEFLKQEVDGKLAEPSTAELEAFHLRQKNLATVPFEQVKSQLLVALKQQKAAQARQDYLRRLRGTAEVAVLLQPPRVEIPYDPTRVLGSPDAPVTIVEFSDFQCPYCRNAAATLRQLMEKYKGQVRLAYRDFPLQPIHSRAQRAAEAGRCATEQGKFWAYHDLLFASPERLSDEDLSEHARTLGLDLTKFHSCLQDGKFKSQVEEDVRAGTRAGVSGTPTFFINGVFLSGSQSLSTFESLIDAELVSKRVEGN